jgi:hypothetical protein
MSQQPQGLDRINEGIALSQGLAQDFANLFVAIKEHVLLAGKVIEHRHPPHIGGGRDFIHGHLIKASLPEEAVRNDRDSSSCGETFA